MFVPPCLRTFFNPSLRLACMNQMPRQGRAARVTSFEVTGFPPALSPRFAPSGNALPTPGQSFPHLPHHCVLHSFTHSWPGFVVWKSLFGSSRQSALSACPTVPIAQRFQPERPALKAQAVNPTPGTTPFTALCSRSLRDPFHSLDRLGMPVRFLHATLTQLVHHGLEGPCGFSSLSFCPVKGKLAMVKLAQATTTPPRAQKSGRPN